MYEDTALGLLCLERRRLVVGRVLRHHILLVVRYHRAWLLRDRILLLLDGVTYLRGRELQIVFSYRLVWRLRRGYSLTDIIGLDSVHLAGSLEPPLRYIIPDFDVGGLQIDRGPLRIDVDSPFNIARAAKLCPDL